MRRWNGIRLGLLAAIVVAMIVPRAAAAADITVSTTADGDDKECAVDCTLREAIALSGSSDRVLVKPGNYVLTLGELFVVNDQIVGDGARTTFIDGGRESRVLWVADGTTALSGVTIRNGNGAGRAPSGVGGGIFVGAGATLQLLNSTVSGNAATGGGGIGVAGTLTAIGVTVSGNQASAGRLTRGGGISSSGGLGLGNSTVSGNTAVDQDGNASEGGGIFSSGGLTLLSSTIANNSAAQGGGLYATTPQTGTLTLSNTIVAAAVGGACAGSAIGSLNAAFNLITDGSCQLKDPSNMQDVNPQLGALANHGGPTNTHALPPTSPAVGSAGSCPQVDQRGFARVAPCDRGAYEYRAPTLRVVTNVVNDAGGTLTPAQVSAHVLIGGKDVDGSPQPGSAAGTTYTLVAGSTYTVAADAVNGYSLSLSGDCSLTLQEGDARTCTITANDIDPTLRVITTVVNDDGGTAVAGDFSVHVRQNGVEVSGSPAPGLVGPVGRLYTLDAGTYVVSADGVAGYSASFSGGCAPAGSVTLALDQDATCTVTLNDIAPTLRVITAVVTDDGGTAVAGDFSVHVRRGAAEVSGSPAPGLVGPNGRLYTVDAGTYVVSADGVAGYSASFSGACAPAGSVTLVLDEDATCTVTLNDIAPTLRVITAVVNDDGGSAVASDFSLHVRRGAAEVSGSPAPGLVGPNGRLYTLDAGAHVVSADGVAGYTQSFSGNCAPAGSVTLALDQDATCTVTLNDIAPTLRIITAVVNNSGGAAEVDDFDVHVRRNSQEVAGSPQAGNPNGTLYTLDAGTYALSADGVPGYSASFAPAVCTTGSITLALDQDATCTITLDDGAGELSVMTQVVNDDGGTAGPSVFSVSVRRGGADVPTSPQPGSATGTTYSLEGNATYSVAAAGASGYVFSTSGDCAPDGSVTVPLAQSRSCTVTANDVAPTLRVVTTVVNDSGGTATAADFPVHVRRDGVDVAGSPQPGNPSGTTYTLDAGSTYSVAVTAILTYSVALSGDCSVTLKEGENRACTVTLEDAAPPPQAQIAQELPPPVPGKQVNLLPESGSVKIKLPGSKAFVALTEGQQIPVGTIVDARKGHVTLVAAADDEGGTATAEFWAGIFKVGQTKGDEPITTATLVEKLTCPAAGKANIAAKKKKRRLWGDGSGNFRTKGKHSAATVVGTKWLVEDKCKSTLTRVVRGRVSVRDFAKKTTVTVRKGKQYIARAKKS